jgi:hypothetical protein
MVLKKQSNIGERKLNEKMIGISEMKTIHKDARGTIYGFYFGDTEYILLVTNKGFARGGCIHRFHDEHAVILKGSVEYHIRGKPVKVFKEGDTVLVKKNTPHYFIALKPSIVMEWGPFPEEKIERHPKWRRTVEKINERKKERLRRCES